MSSPHPLLATKSSKPSLGSSSNSSSALQVRRSQTSEATESGLNPRVRIPKMILGKFPARIPGYAECVFNFIIIPECCISRLSDDCDNPKPQGRWELKEILENREPRDNPHSSLSGPRSFREVVCKILHLCLEHCNKYRVDIAFKNGWFEFFGYKSRFDWTGVEKAAAQESECFAVVVTSLNFNLAAELDDD